ncbi:hypothetical protein Tco_1433368 [Tanacetum coccineum]
METTNGLKTHTAYLPDPKKQIPDKHRRRAATGSASTGGEQQQVPATLGWLLEEIHVTWAHLEKKRTRLRLYTKSLEEIIIQMVETASPTLATTSKLDQDGVRNITKVSECSRLK